MRALDATRDRAAQNQVASATASETFAPGTMTWRDAKSIERHCFQQGTHTSTPPETRLQ